MMEPFMMRGYIFRSTLQFIREGLDPARRELVLKRVSPETLRFCEELKPVAFYPIQKQNELVGAIAEAANGDETTAESDLMNVGKFVARGATNTFLRLVMKVLTPRLFAKKLPTLHSRDNTRGRVTVDATNEMLICRFEDLGQYTHGCPVGMGFATFALEALGKQLLSHKAHVWSLANPAPDSCWFECRWKT